MEVRSSAFPRPRDPNGLEKLIVDEPVDNGMIII